MWSVVWAWHGYSKIQLHIKAAVLLRKNLFLTDLLIILVCNLLTSEVRCLCSRCIECSYLRGYTASPDKVFLSLLCSFMIPCNDLDQRLDLGHHGDGVSVAHPVALGGLCGGGLGCSQIYRQYRQWVTVVIEWHLSMLLACEGHGVRQAES